MKSLTCSGTCPSRLLTPPAALSLAATLWMMVFHNQALLTRLFKLYPVGGGESGLLLSLISFFSLATWLWLLLILHGRSARWLLALTLLGSAITGFYMQTFGVVIDSVMLDNIRHTDSKEAVGLYSAEMLGWVILTGLIPALWVIFKAPQACFKTEGWKLRGTQTLLVLSLMLACVWPNSAGYASFIREHKLVRMYANPTFVHYSLLKWLQQHTRPVDNGSLMAIATDTHPVVSGGKPELVIMVVGETARYDRFALNGYHKPTNPRLLKENIVSFKQVTSCGTSTGVSVPCMFSILGRKDYDEDKAKHMENALDVLKQHGVHVLWRDNNSDSKGVAIRVPYDDYQTPARNTQCDRECRDVGMLVGLDKIVAEHRQQDMLIVLHQMGNHGPEYYRRYPKAFEKFTPVCKESDLSKCSQEEIDNAYDNAILYTDYFLSEVIRFLKQYDNSHETAMLYVSDHGESLGEHGIYLHAAPYMIAPREQTHVPAILWLGQHFDYQLGQIQPYANYPLSHDDLFCTLLTAYELKSDVCHAQYGWLMQNRDIRSHLHLPALPLPGLTTPANTTASQHAMALPPARAVNKGAHAQESHAQESHAQESHAQGSHAQGSYA